MLQRATAEVYSVRLTVRPSVTHTCDPRLNGLRYQNTFHIIRYSDVHSFLMSNFVVLSSGAHSEKVY